LKLNHRKSEHETNTIVSKGRSDYSIVYGTETDDLISFAAEELQRYLEKMSKVRIPVEANDSLRGKHCLILLHNKDVAKAIYEKVRPELKSLPVDSFIVGTIKKSFFLGGTHRGTLYAAYAFLENLGCRWFVPGPDGEIVPKSKTIRIGRLSMREAPSFRRRGFGEDASHVFGQPYWERVQIEDDKLFLDWLAKNRLNHCHHFAEELMPEVMKRGFLISTAYGETLITRLLPRELFNEHPEYFREDASGKRVRSGNMCVSNEEAMQIVVKNAVAYANRHPEVYSARVSTQDIWGGGWCHCEKCQNLTPQDQYVMVTNAIAKAWDEAGVNTKSLNVPYRDTLEANLSIKPDERTLFEFHPRERCYAHSLADERCERNWWYRYNFERWTKAIGKAEMDILGYYGDCILFNSFPVPLTRVIAEDMAYYRKVTGGAGVSYLLMGKFCWWAYPLNMYLFAKLAWNTDLDPSALLDDYFKKMYGNAAASMKDYFSKMEEAISKEVTYTEPILDPPQTYDPIMEKLFFLLRESIQLLEECSKILTEVESRSLCEVVARRVRDERLMLTFATKQTSGLLHQVQGQYWLALAQHEDLERAALLGPRTKVPTPERLYREMWGDVPSPYALAREEFEKAQKEYEGAFEFMESLPDELRSSWLASDFGYKAYALRLINMVQLKIAECDKGIASGLR